MFALVTCTFPPRVRIWQRALTALTGRSGCQWRGLLESVVTRLQLPGAGTSREGPPDTAPCCTIHTRQYVAAHRQPSSSRSYRVTTHCDTQSRVHTTTHFSTASSPLYRNTLSQSVVITITIDVHQPRDTYHTSAPSSTATTPRVGAMIAHLRILLLCALLLLSWQSVSTSASASSADVAASDATAQPEMFYKVDPREDSTVYEIPFVQANFDVPITPHTQPLTPIASRRPDSMEGAVDSFNRASDVRPTEDGVAEEEAVDHTMRPLQAGSQFTMQRRTSMAPWSPRIQPGLMYRSREITYTQAKTGLRVRLGAGYLLMYEGGMTNRTGVVTYSIENDVWISNDDGITWDLIAGRSEYGPSGPTSSPNNNGVTFDARSGSNNCNDPASDLIISLGGNNATTLSSTSSTYYSYTGVNWQLNNPLTTPTWAPIRHFSSCDITERGDVMLIGGQLPH